MVVYTVYSSNVKQHYRASICSSASIFGVIVWAILILSPLFISYQSSGFWLKESTYREQPEVHFKHEFIILLQGANLNTLLGYSTNANLKNLFGGNHLRIPIIKSYETDDNNDGLKDSLTFDVEIPLQLPETIHSLQLMLFFDYKLYRYTSLHMESLAYIQYDSFLSGEEFFSEGYLKFQQKSPLPHRGKYTKFNTSIIEDSANSHANIHSLQNIVQTYQDRNVTTDFIGRYPIWRSGHTDSFKVHVKIDYPEETIIYRPGFWQLIKFAWLQYLSILFIFLFIFDIVKRFVFGNQLVNTIPQKVHTD